MLSVITKSEEETQKFGYDFAKSLDLNQLPVIIKLIGEVGSGKTTFTRGFLKFFNIENARSPSFTIINEYNANNLKIYHIDFYRIKGFEFENLGIDEILMRKAIIIIEWPENVSLNLEKTIDIKFEILSESERKITIIE
ncbi:MAG: tRNA (adenosine(37)-N6)-threonylcarbamoyltransferase complex ATPase subunit type 1 TsaE [candidate division WOR-3 bacterium]